MKNTPNVVMPARRQSPTRLERRKQAGDIEIAPPDEALDDEDDEVESVEDPMARKAGAKSSYLRELSKQNKKEA